MCYRDSDPTTYVKSLVIDSSTQGAIFEYSFSNIQEPFSKIGVDIVFTCQNYISIQVSINNSPIKRLVSLPSYYDENKSIKCPNASQSTGYEELTFNRGEQIIDATTLLSNNKFILNLIKQNQTAEVSIRNMRIWTNCSTNCEYCYSSTICKRCFGNFVKKRLVTGEIACEQHTGCMIRYCRSCWKGVNYEECKLCEPGSKFDEFSICTPISNPNHCSWTTYSSEVDLKCVKKSNQCLFQNRATGKLEQIKTSDSLDSYYAFHNEMIIKYDRENYNLTYVGCLIKNCASCNYNSNCESCLPGYTYNSVTQLCDNNCQEGTYYNNKLSTCTKCIENCSSCQNNFDCDICSNGFKMNFRDLTCSTCDENCVSIKLKSQKVNDDSYELYFTFTPELSTISDTLLDFKIIGKTDFTFELSSLTLQQMKVIVSPNSNVQHKKGVITITNPTFADDNSLSMKSVTFDLKTFIILSREFKQASAAVSSIGNAASTIVVSSILPIAILSNFYILVNTIDITGFLYYLLFIDIRHPKNVKDFYSIFQNFQFPFIPNIFNGAINSNYTQEAPSKFQEMSTDLYFLKNVGQTITIWVIIVGVYIIGKILSYFKIPILSNYLKKALDRSWEFSAFFDMIWNTYIYALVGSLLQFQCYNSADSSFFTNYLLHTICFITMISMPFLIFYLIYREKNIKTSQRFSQRYFTLVGGIVIFDNICQDEDKKKESNVVPNDLPRSEKSQQNVDIQEDQNNERQLERNLEPQEADKKALKNENKIQKKLSKYFTPILYLRKLLFGIIISSAYNSPYFQLTSIIILALSVLIFLIAVQPLTSKHEIIKNCAGEITIIVICTCAMPLVDDSEEDVEVKRIKIGWAIVFFSGILLLWHTIQLLKESLILIYELLRKVLILLLNQLGISMQQFTKGELTTEITTQQQSKKIYPFNLEEKSIRLNTSLELKQNDNQIKEIHIQSDQDMKLINSNKSIHLRQNTDNQYFAESPRVDNPYNEELQFGYQNPKQRQSNSLKFSHKQSKSYEALQLTNTKDQINTEKILTSSFQL